MKKKKRLMQVDIIKGNKKITYHIDPSVNLTVNDDGSIFLNEMATVEQMTENIKNPIFPAELRYQFHSNCSLKFSDDIVKDDFTEKTT
jgi:hypothetical protein